MAATMKKVLTVVTCTVMALACAFALTACGGAQSKTDAATKALEGMLDQIEKGGLTEYLDSSNMMDLSSYGIDYSSIVESMSDSFSYEIKGSQEESDGNVLVDVQISSKQIVPAVVNSFQQVYTEMMNMDASSLATTDYTELQTQMMDRFSELIQQEMQNEALCNRLSPGCWHPCSSFRCKPVGTN